MAEMMGKMDIAFPNLGIYLENVPKSFQVFGITIALYGVIIAIGIMLGFHMAAYCGKKDGMSEDTFWDFSIWAIVGSVAGARVYYVIFSWDRYKNNLLDIFNIRQGGLAIYGAVIAGFLICFIYTKIKKVSFLKMADAASAGLLVGQAIGRWGNFTNREVFGDYSDGLFAMRLPIEMVRQSDISPGIAKHIGEGMNYIQVHPTFLYESLWNLAVLGLILFFWKYKRFNGEVALWYLGGYGLGRLWIEGIRTDQLLLPGTSIAVSQCVALVCILIAVVGEVVVRQKIHKNKKAEA